MIARVWNIGRMHIVAIAALGTLTFSWVFTGVYLWEVTLICALDWFLVNLLNRVVDLEEDEINGVLGSDIVAANKRGVLILGFGLLAASMALTAIRLPWLLPWRAGYHLLGFAYNWPIIPGVGRIKELYFFKNSASALGFVITVFCYPLAAAHSAGVARLPDIDWPAIAAITVFFFLFEISYEVIYDLRDAEGDRAAGVRTYPVVHGEAVAGRIVEGLLGGSFVILVGSWLAGVMPWRVAAMGVAPLMQWVLYRRWSKRGLTSKDCIRLTWLGAVLLALYHVWIWLELPGVV